MDLKEFFMTALAVAVGCVIAKVISNRVPILNQKSDEDYDADYDADYDSASEYDSAID